MGSLHLTLCHRSSRRYAFARSSSKMVTWTKRAMQLSKVFFSLAVYHSVNQARLFPLLQSSGSFLVSWSVSSFTSSQVDQVWPLITYAFLTSF